MNTIFTKKWTARTIGAAMILGLVLWIGCDTVAGQDVERGKTISAEKKKKFSTEWVVCIETVSGKRYSIKWNAHTYYSKNVRIPQEWTVALFKTRYFIKPVL